MMGYQCLRQRVTSRRYAVKGLGVSVLACIFYFSFLSQTKHNIFYIQEYAKQGTLFSGNDTQLITGNQQVSIDDVRILVWVMTYPKNLKTAAIQVNRTWAKRVDTVYASDYYDPSFPTMNITTAKGRGNLSNKTWTAFDYLYKHYLDDYDWFLKADDDTYLIVENLKYFLSTQNPEEPVFFGHELKDKHVEQGFYQGGSGYVISKEALRRFGQRSKVNPNNNCTSFLGSKYKGYRAAEDIDFAVCLASLGVKTKDSLDSSGKSRFHGLPPVAMLTGSFPGWYRKMDRHGAKQKGLDGISEMAISFHKVSPEMMIELEYFIYHLRVYNGILKN